MSEIQHARIAELCAELRLKVVDGAWPAAAQAAVTREATFGDFLEEVLRAEADARQVRAKEMAARVAGFPAIKTLESFDWGFATGAPRKQIMELASLTFTLRGGGPFAQARVTLATPASGGRVLSISRTLRQPTAELPAPAALRAQLEDLYGPPSKAETDPGPRGALRLTWAWWCWDGTRWRAPSRPATSRSCASPATQ